MKRFYFGILTITLVVVGCASKILKYDRAEDLKKNDEFERAVKIIIPETTATQPPMIVAPASEVVVPTTSTTTTSTTIPQKAKKEKKSKKKEAMESLPTRRQPDMESDQGFNGRRPIKDPFRVGEKVVHEIGYAGLTAGQLSFETRPFAEVNNRKSYNFAITIKSTSIFSKFYAVDDLVTTLVDFESLVPSVYSLEVKESSQLREARMFFDWQNSHAKFWEKKVTEKNGMEEKKLDWEILPFSQNVFSIIFYLRVFQWDVGSVHSFRVAHDDENLIFKATAIRREKIKTDVGEFTALVIKPEMELKGFFKPIGENYIWISDDDRKLVLRIESKIKIGTLVSEVVDIQPGQP